MITKMGARLGTFRDARRRWHERCVMSGLFFMSVCCLLSKIRFAFLRDPLDWPGQKKKRDKRF